MKKIIIVFILVLIPVSSFALSGSFVLDSLIQSPTRIDLDSGATSFYSINLNMFNVLLDAYQAGQQVVIDYESSGEINSISLNSQLYPVADFSKISSFFIGGLAALAFVFGCKIKF